MALLSLLLSLLIHAGSIMPMDGLGSVSGIAPKHQDGLGSISAIGPKHQDGLGSLSGTK